MHPCSAQAMHESPFKKLEKFVKTAVIKDSSNPNEVYYINRDNQLDDSECSVYWMYYSPETT